MKDADYSNKMLIYPNKNQFSAIIGISFCACLITLALPRLIAAFYMLYPAQVSKQFVQNPNLINLDQFIKSEAYINKALSWFETGKNWQILTLTEARQLNLIEPSSRHQQIQKMYQASIQGLALSPVDPYNWYRLAIIERSLNSSPNRIINDLRLSCYAGRVEPELLLSRVALLHQYQAFLNHEMLEVLYEQIRLSRLIRQKGLIKLLQQQSSLIPVVQKALQYDAEFLNKNHLLFDKIDYKNKKSTQS